MTSPTPAAATRRLVGPAEAALVPAARLGGKAQNLLVLAGAGLRVPPWFCLTTEVFEELTEPFAAEIDRVAASLDIADYGALRRTSAALRARVHERGLPAADREALLRRFDEEFSLDAMVAVRSSAVGEDSGQDSFAGQLSTYLYVTRDELVDRVLDCFASVLSERALVYRRLRGQEQARARTAVIVQRMIDSRVAGVLFTVNPQTGAEREAVVAAGLGLGEGIVGGSVESDTFFVDLPTGRVVDRTIVAKQSRVAFDRARGHGVVTEAVPAAEGARPALADAQVAELAALGRRLQEVCGRPQDVEWAIDGAGQVCLLQTRPITTLGRGRESIFDNANIVESYPGLTAPLTFTFARRAYEVAFTAFLANYGVPRRRIERASGRLANLLALIDGRVYYNILSWYGFVRLVPGFEWTLAAWEKALGLTQRRERPIRRTWWQKLRSAPLVLWVYLHVLWQVLGIDRHARRYVTTLAQTRAELRQRAPGSLDAHDLLDRLDALGRRLLGPYSVSIVNDAITQQYLAALGKLIDRYELGGLSASLANDLLAGETGMESVAPVRSLLALAEQVRQRPELRALFDGDLAAPEVWRRVHEEPDCAMFRAELGRHLELYGDRTLHELKLETPQAEDNPAFVVAMLRNYLRGGQNVEALEARERHRRQVAEEAVARALRRRPLRRWLFGWVLRKVRRGVKHREDLRLARSRGYGLVKRVYRALGAHFVDAGALAAPADVFWLTAEEVAGFVRGHAVSCDLRTVVAQRQREYEGFRLTRPPPRLTTHGLVYRQPFVGCASAGAGDGEVLQGIGCCSGRVRAPAKVILDPSEDLRIGGEILVAPMTDPGWVFLMVAAGGIVSEKGSLLSHTAIIGRELGVPTVVGVPAAASRIADGEMIELDGTAGTVRRVKPPAPAPAE